MGGRANEEGERGFPKNNYHMGNRLPSGCDFFWVSPKLMGMNKII